MPYSATGRGTCRRRFWDIDGTRQHPGGYVSGRLTSRSRRRASRTGGGRRSGHARGTSALRPGAGTPGALNAITDVAGVRVGHVTSERRRPCAPGVTAILPHGGNLFREKVPGAVFVGNAFGKLAGSTQVEELGTIETPIVLTNTLSVGAALDGVARWTLAQPGNENVRSVNGLVGETNDGALNDIRGFHVTRRARRAGDRRCHERRGGRGSGRRRHRHDRVRLERRHRHVVARRDSGRMWTVGVLVQTNYGGRLTIAACRCGRSSTPTRSRIRLRRPSHLRRFGGTRPRAS